MSALWWFIYRRSIEDVSQLAMSIFSMFAICTKCNLYRGHTNTCDLQLERQCAVSFYFLINRI